MPPVLTDLLEVRMYGLNISITTEALGEYLSKGDLVRLRGILLHPQGEGGFQWAQVWVSTEAEVANLLALRSALAVNGIATPPNTTWDLPSQLLKPKGVPSRFGVYPVSRSPNGLTDASSNLPRNLYILNLPLDLTQIEFKDLLTPYGVVEHSTLLSQLDGIGRRRGFVLMSSHSEATEAMRNMHGNGCKLDVSWALVQREPRNVMNSAAAYDLTPTTDTLPNRVVHPPAMSSRREPFSGACVVVDNLDPHLFPDCDTVSAIFRSFGPIDRTIKLSGTSVLIQFDNAISAAALVKANGLKLGDSTLQTKHLHSMSSVASPDTSQMPASAKWHESEKPQTRRSSDALLPVTPPRSQSSRSSALNAESRPFVPGSDPASSISASVSAPDLLTPNYHSHLSTSTNSPAELSSPSDRHSDKSPFLTAMRASPSSMADVNIVLK